MVLTAMNHCGLLFCTTVVHEGCDMHEERFSQAKVRLPTDLKEWIAAQSQINRSSQNSEVVRAVRERKERVEMKEAA